MTDKEKVLNNMREYFEYKSIALPAEIQILDCGNAVCMVLCSEKIVKDNMQEAGNAFEAWSTAIHLVTKKAIILDTDCPLDYDKYENQEHLCRFLYRALRFQEQYSWFDLSDYLQDEISKFNAYISNGNFINNYPHGDAGTKDKHNAENRVEEIISKDGISGFITNNPIYRQLPVGLYKDSLSAKNMVFNGGKAAIDLWTWKDSEFFVIELKADRKKQTKMAGIVTEIFFYSNYMRDLLCRQVFTLNRDVYTSERGYEKILNGSFNAITGVMLANVYHPIITQNFLDVLNDNCGEISYEKRTYDIDKYYQ
jgi:hypothetical protein